MQYFEVSGGKMPQMPPPLVARLAYAYFRKLMVCSVSFRKSFKKRYYFSGEERLSTKKITTVFTLVLLQ